MRHTSRAVHTDLLILSRPRDSARVMLLTRLDDNFPPFSPFPFGCFGEALTGPRKSLKVEQRKGREVRVLRNVFALFFVDYEKNLESELFIKLCSGYYGLLVGGFRNKLFFKSWVSGLKI